MLFYVKKISNKDIPRRCNEIYTGMKTLQAMFRIPMKTITYVAVIKRVRFMISEFSIKKHSETLK